MDRFNYMRKTYNKNLTNALLDRHNNLFSDEGEMQQHLLKACEEWEEKSKQVEKDIVRGVLRLSGSTAIPSATQGSVPTFNTNPHQPKNISIRNLFKVLSTRYQQ